MTAPDLEVRRSGERFVTEAEGRVTRHSFSFDRHYDPANVGVGALVCHNEDLVQPGHGYPDHPHRDLEIVTWVLGGALLHRGGPGDDDGLVAPGTVQHLGAGSGVLHAEVNEAAEPVHFVQMWVRPEEPGLPPSYARAPATVEPGAGWVPLASGLPEDAGSTVLPLRNGGAGLRVARLSVGDELLLPAGPLLHLFVAGGSVDVEEAGPLAAGDALRDTGGGGRRLTARADSEVLVWELRGDQRPG